MGIFTGLFDKVKNAADMAYHYVLPKSGLEYAKASLNAVGKLTKDLVLDGLSTVELAFKSVARATPVLFKSLANVFKGLFSDLPQAAYYRYQENEVESNAALEQAGKDFSEASNQLIEAFSRCASTAYNGIKPILSDATNSIAYNGGEALINASAAGSVAFVEGVKAFANALIPAVSELNPEEILKPCLFMFNQQRKSLKPFFQDLEMSASKPKLSRAAAAA